LGSIFGGGKSGGFQAQGPSQAQVKTAYNQSQDALAQQKAFVQQLQAQNGLGNQQDVFAQQQALANQIQGVANGTGPNPALNQLNQATGQNVSNQAALMASQRGAATNTGLIARQAAMQGAGTQQQAAGQAATLQAQQQIAAMGQLQGQQANMANLATQQVGQTQTGLNAYGQQAGNQYSTVLGAQGNANQINASMAQQRAAAENNMMSNLTGAIGRGVAGYMTGGLSEGVIQAAKPEVKAEGGVVGSQQPKGPRSKIGQHLMMAEGGKVPLLLSPGEKVLDPKAVQEVAKGASPMAKGKEVPGKAKVGGAVNDYANDTYKTAEPTGSIILPRSVTQAKGDKDTKARAFVEAILSKKSKTLPKK
jgi:hypothetical protein